MAIDPACGVEVDEKKAQYTTHFLGRTFYFCTDACKADFERDPRKFVNTKGEIIYREPPPVTKEGDVFGKQGTKGGPQLVGTARIPGQPKATNIEQELQEEGAETQGGLEQGGNRSMRPRVQAGTDQESKGAGGEWHGEGWTEEGHREAASQGRPGAAKQKGPSVVKGQGSRLQDKKTKPGKKYGT